MILLTELDQIEEYYRIKSLFEMKGILLFTGNEDSARNFGFFHPVGKYAIHILYHEQLADAQALLENENHDVVNPMNVEQYQAHQRETKAQTGRLILKTLFVVLLTLFVLTIGVSLTVLR